MACLWIVGVFVQTHIQRRQIQIEGMDGQDSSATLVRLNVTGDFDRRDYLGGALEQVGNKHIAY